MDANVENKASVSKLDQGVESWCYGTLLSKQYAMKLLRAFY